MLENITSTSLNQGTRRMEIYVVGRSCKPFVIVIGLGGRGRRAIWLRVGRLDVCLGLVIGIEATHKVMDFGQRCERAFRWWECRLDGGNWFGRIIAKKAFHLGIMDGRSMRG